MPSIIKKTYCKRCGKEVPLFGGGQKISGGYICTPCKKKLQPYLEKRRMPFPELTLELIEEIDAEIAVDEEAERQKQKENTKKAAIMLGVCFVALLVIGAFSSKTSKDDEEDATAMEEQTIENEDIENNGAEDSLVNASHKENVYHLKIEGMPAELKKEEAENGYIWRFDDDNYMLVLQHDDIVSYFSNVDDNFPAMCNIIQEQSNIAISDSFFSSKDRDHYVYYGETTIDGKPYNVMGHLYATIQGMDEIRFYTSDFYRDSEYKTYIEQIISSTSILLNSKMHEAPPSQESPQTPEATGPITAANNDDFDQLMSIADPDEDPIRQFANKYAGKEIEFDGCVMYSEGNRLVVWYGNYEGENDYSHDGPEMLLRSVNPNTYGNGDNIHVVARVASYKDMSWQLYLDCVIIYPR